MDGERLRVQAEVYFLRWRGRFRTALQILGVVLVLVGAANLFPGVEILAQYRTVVPLRAAVGPSRDALIPVADILVMAAGASLAWFL